jgi:hypothetical protein
MMERRREHRLLCADLVRVSWLARDRIAPDMDARDALRICEAVLEDICPSGACLQVQQPIPPGAAVLISVHGENLPRLAGIASYCEPGEYGYSIGIRFSDESLWSVDLFEPEHLTSPEELYCAPP